MNWVIPPPAFVALPVDGTDAAFPVARVFCVGRNYAEHAVEMGHDPDREPPFFFMKPATAVVPLGGRLPFPSPPMTSTTRSSWSSRWALAAPTSRRIRPWSACSGTPWGST